MMYNYSRILRKSLVHNPNIYKELRKKILCKVCINGKKVCPACNSYTQSIIEYHREQGHVCVKCNNTGFINCDCL